MLVVVAPMSCREFEATSPGDVPALRLVSAFRQPHMRPAQLLPAWQPFQQPPATREHLMYPHQLGISTSVDPNMLRAMRILQASSASEGSWFRHLSLASSVYVVSACQLTVASECFCACKACNLWPKCHTDGHSPISSQLNLAPHMQAGFLRLPAAQLPRCPLSGVPFAGARPAAGSVPLHAAPAPFVPARLLCQHPLPAMYIPISSQIVRAAGSDSKLACLACHFCNAGACPAADSVPLRTTPALPAPARCPVCILSLQSSHIQ